MGKEERTPVGVERIIKKYFQRCDEEGSFYGEAGLALALGVERETLWAWYDGTERPELQRVIRWAYLRIQEQLESSRRYAERGLTTRALFLLKQPRLGGYSEKGEDKEVTVRIELGKTMDESDGM